MIVNNRFIPTVDIIEAQILSMPESMTFTTPLPDMSVQQNELKLRLEQVNGGDYCYQNQLGPREHGTQHQQLQQQACLQYNHPHSAYFVSHSSFNYPDELRSALVPESDTPPHHHHAHDCCLPTSSSASPNSDALLTMSSGVLSSSSSGADTVFGIETPTNMDFFEPHESYCYTTSMASDSWLTHDSRKTSIVPSTVDVPAGATPASCHGNQDYYVVPATAKSDAREPQSEAQGKSTRPAATPAITPRVIKPKTTRKSNPAKMIDYENMQKTYTQQLRENPEVWKIVNIRKKKGIFKCSHCAEFFPTLYMLAQHFDEHKVARYFQCPFKGCVWNILGLPRRAEVRRHCSSQHATKIEFERCNENRLNATPTTNVEKIICSHENCNRAFKRKDSLQRHIKLVHDNPHSRFNKRLLRDGCPSASTAARSAQQEVDFLLPQDALSIIDETLFK